MYKVDSNPISVSPGRVPTGGLLASVLVPGHLVLLSMRLALSLPGKEAGWRHEVRRQSESVFFRDVYAAVFWFMMMVAVGVFWAT